MQESTFSRHHNGVKRIVDCCACADACKHAHQKHATNPRLPDARSTRTEMSNRQRTGVNHLTQPMGSSPADAARRTRTFPCVQQPYGAYNRNSSYILKWSNSCYKLLACWFHFEILPVIAKSFQKQAAQISTPAVPCCTSPSRTCTCPQGSTQQTREMNTFRKYKPLLHFFKKYFRNTTFTTIISSHKIPTNAIQLIFNMIF